MDFSSCFQFEAIMSKATINTLVRVFSCGAIGLPTRSRKIALNYIQTLFITSSSSSSSSSSPFPI